MRRWKAPTRLEKTRNGDENEEAKNGIEIGFIGVSAAFNPKMMIESMC